MPRTPGVSAGPLDRNGVDAGAVPLPVIQQLLGRADPRTGSIYTRVAATSRTNALSDAGML